MLFSPMQGHTGFYLGLYACGIGIAIGAVGGAILGAAFTSREKRATGAILDAAAGGIIGLILVYVIL